MGSAHRVFNDMGRAIDLKEAVVVPTTNVVADLDGMDMAVIQSGTANVLLPNREAGTTVRVVATGTVVIKNAAGSTITTLTTGETGFFTATATSGTWTYLQSQTAGATILASDVSIADANSLIGVTTVEAALQSLAQRTKETISTANTTAGAGTLTAASLVGGLIVRSGASAAYTDTTDTAASIAAALPASSADDPWSRVIYIQNTVAFTQTIAGGAGVTVSGITKLPANSIGKFILQYDTSDLAQLVGIEITKQCVLPNGQFNTTAAGSPVTPAAGILTGANHVHYAVTTSGAFGITTRTAAELYGDIPNCHVGFSFYLTIISDGDNTVTVTGGSNVTLPGTPDTAATNTTKTFLCTFTTASAMTMQVVNMGTIDATV